MDSSSLPNPETELDSGEKSVPVYGVRSEREQILEAMLRVASSKGYEETTVADVISAADVSQQTFDRLFADRQECFLAAYDAAADVGAFYVIAAFEAAEGKPWPQRMRSALRALVDLFEAEAAIIRMAMIEVTAMGEDPRVLYRDALARFEPLFDEGFRYSPQGKDLPADTASFAVAAAVSIIFDEMRAGRGQELRRILPDLGYAVLMPYLGPQAAEAEMQRVGPASEGGKAL
jgi:AcrR family transcriptional regulator